MILVLNNRTGAVAYVYGTTGGTKSITLNKVYNVSDYPVNNWFGYGIDITGSTANAYLTLTKNNWRLKNT